MTMTLTPTEIPQDFPPEDEAPEIDSPGYDPEAPFGRTPTGRIRKRPVGTRVKASVTGGTPARSERLARQATAIIVQVNGYLVLGATVAMMPETASRLSEREQTFENQVYNALVLDPGLCERILKAGVKSGSLMLLVAIVTHAASVVPTAVVEMQTKKRERLEEAA